MPSQLSTGDWISPDARYGVVSHGEGPRWFELDPEPGEPTPLFDDGELMSVSAVFDAHLLYTTAERSRLWAAPLDEAGPGPSVSLEARLLGPVAAVGVSWILDAHDVVLEVQPGPDAPAHLQLLQLEQGTQTLRLDDDPRAQRVMHALVRE